MEEVGPRRSPLGRGRLYRRDADGGTWRGAGSRKNRGVARGGICSGGVARNVEGQRARFGGWGGYERCVEELKVETVWAL